MNRDQTDFIDYLLAPLRVFLSPSEDLFFLYLLTAMPLILVSYRLFYTREDEYKRHGFLRFLFPRSIWRSPSAWLDIRFYVINLFVFSTFLVVLERPLRSLMNTFLFQGAGVPEVVFANIDDVVTIAGSESPLWGVAKATGVSLLVFLAVELKLYLVHLAFHKVPILWEFHKTHHSARVLTPLSVFRGHPVPGLTQALLRTVVAAISSYVALRITDAPALAVMGVNVFLFISLCLAECLNHSHIWLHYGKPLNYVLISPAHHQIHHSEDPRHWCKNMGGLTAVWDWVFGTLYVPGKRESITVGLASDEENELFNRGVWSLYWTPFRGVWRFHAKPWLNRRFGL